MNKQEQHIQDLMDILDITREEALQVIADDERIDKGEKLFELTKEQKKASKEARITHDKVVNAYGKETKRERKVNNEKVDIINQLIDNVISKFDNVNIINPEREVEFTKDGKKYKVVLSMPRK